MKIANYQLNDLIYESNNSLVYKATTLTSNRKSIIKILKQEYPTPEQLFQYKQEYQITHNTKLEGVIRSYDLQTYQRSLMIIFEDFGATSLKKLFPENPISIPLFFNLAIQVTEILERIHSANIIHKDLNPANIVLNPETKILKVIDFGISTQLNQEYPNEQNLSILEGTLPYISPEQTGRMNRFIDYRTDFYSLGITFYELLTAQLPFQSNDPLELVHCHLAKEPIPPHKLNSEIPPVVSQLIMKMIAKTAEERYQSAAGIKADLERCLEQFSNRKEITKFSLGSQDISDRFQIPQKLYSREEEIQKLLDAFERISQGQSEIILVSGEAGVGKSALVKELYKPITRQRGYFISGKFDQLQRHIPYTALIKAFSELIQKILGESEAAIQEWKNKLLSALGENGQVIIEVISEVELIIGQQPKVSELPPLEAENRFNLVFRKFIDVFTDTEHSLVIFLDDLQWSDLASLALLKNVITQLDCQHLLIIAAYRNNEVHAGHPLSLTLNEIKNQGIHVEDIWLQGLSFESIHDLVSDTLNYDGKQTIALSKLIFQKTQGNPFFINEFLKYLYKKELIYFEKADKKWQWKLEQIQSSPITDNVVELMANKIERLPDSTRNLLKIAACLGNQFSLKLLTIINQKTQHETAIDLREAIQEGLILFLGSESNLFMTDESAESLQVNCKFVHDRVQQAAYSLISDDDKKNVHLQIGQLLLQKFSAEEREENIFNILYQLNYSHDLLIEQSERYRLAELNLLAGKKAKFSAAYQTAFNYFIQGINLLADDQWQKQYDLSLSLYIEASEAASLCGHFDQMKKYIEMVLQNGHTLLDKVKVYEVEISACITQQKLNQAIDLGLEVLKLLGLYLPRKPKTSHILAYLAKTRIILINNSVEKLANLPEMVNTHSKVTMRILTRISSPAYLSEPNLLLLIVLTGIQLSVKYGNTKESSLMYAFYSTILCGIFGNIKFGYQLGELALKLLDRFDAKILAAKALVAVNIGVIHWQVHLKQTLQSLKDTYLIATEIGDLEYAGYSAGIYSAHTWFCQSDLAVAQQEIAQYISAVKNFNQEQNLHNINLSRQTILNLMGKSEDPCLLIGEAYNEIQRLPIDIENNERNTIFHVYVYKMMLSYLFYKPNQALENSILAKEYINGGTGTFTITLFYFYDSLTRLSLYPSLPPSKQKELYKQVKFNQNKMKKWAYYAPMNHAHKFHLVEAECLRVCGENAKATENYEQAIALAKENEYLREEALAYELAAKFYLAQNKQIWAKFYLQEAHYCYSLWGATAKVKHLEEHYPHLLTSSRSNENKNSTTITSQQRNESLDLATVIKASQSIAEEIVLEKLLTNLMQILIANAGAETGMILLEKEGNLFIEAKGTVHASNFPILQSLPIENSLPLSLIHYVTRTLTSIVLDEASQEGNFINDPYIQTYQPKSILCAPLLNQGQLKGIIYLENNLTVAAFTPERVKLIQLLSGQAAIAIENAQLYNSLEQKVTERTQELSKTLAELQTTQQELVQSEKMAALGQLIAGIAHEINTPLGVITSAARNIHNFFNQNLFSFMRFWETLSPQQQEDFLALIQKANNQPSLLTTREQRQIRKSLTSALETHQIKKSQNLAKILLNLGIYENLEPWLSLLQDSEGEKLLKTASDVANVQTSIQNISTAADKAAKVVFALKTYARHNREGEKVKADIPQGIETVLTLYQNSLKQGVEVVRHYSKELPLLLCYPDELNQVWTNLIYNALQAMEYRGRLIIEVKQEEHHISVTITDNGQGIEPEILPKIFEPFFTTKPAGEGSGLGLHIVRQIIQKHQGAIEVTSKPGKTTFTVLLPLQLLP